MSRICGEPTLSYSNCQERGSRQELLTHMVTMTTKAKRQGPIMFQAPLRSSCKDMANTSVPSRSRT